MNSTVDIPPVQEMDAEAFDVIIIGAGLSGIGTAVRLQRDCPDRDFHPVGATRRDRRHLGSVSVSRHSL